MSVDGCMARDRLGVVAGDAVEVAALDEYHVPVAGPVDDAGSDGVGECSSRMDLTGTDPLHGPFGHVV